MCPYLWLVRALDFSLITPFNEVKHFIGGAPVWNYIVFLELGETCGVADRFPYAFHVNSGYCCATNTEKNDGTDATCDGSALHADGVLSMCCDTSPAMEDQHSQIRATFHRDSINSRRCSKDQEGIK